MDRAAMVCGKSGVSGPVDIGELHVDVERGKVWVRGRRIDARPAVVGLLGLLGRARPRVLARRELCERLWPAAAVADGALRVCVAEARRLLRDATGELWIETV